MKYKSISVVVHHNTTKETEQGLGFNMVLDGKFHRNYNSFYGASVEECLEDANLSDNRAIKTAFKRWVDDLGEQDLYVLMRHKECDIFVAINGDKMVFGPRSGGRTKKIESVRCIFNKENDTTTYRILESVRMKRAADFTAKLRGE